MCLVLTRAVLRRLHPDQYILYIPTRPLFENMKICPFPCCQHGREVRVLSSVKQQKKLYISNDCYASCGSINNCKELFSAHLGDVRNQLGEAS